METTKAGKDVISVCLFLILHLKTGSSEADFTVFTDTFHKNHVLSLFVGSEKIEIGFSVCEANFRIPV